MPSVAHTSPSSQILHPHRKLAASSSSSPRVQRTSSLFLLHLVPSLRKSQSVLHRIVRRRSRLGLRSSCLLRDGKPVAAGGALALRWASLSYVDQGEQLDCRWELCQVFLHVARSWERGGGRRANLALLEFVDTAWTLSRSTKDANRGGVQKVKGSRAQGKQQSPW